MSERHHSTIPHGAPERPVSRPTRSLSQLPYNEVLTWERFELFAAELLNRSGSYSSVVNYGTKGNAQYGVDIVAVRSDERWAFQCKRVAKFAPAQFRRAIEGTRYEADRYVLILSCSATTSVIDEARRGGWEVWDNRVLDRMVLGLHDDATELIEGYFGRAYVEAFLGRASSPFLRAHDYFRPYLSSDRMLALDGTLIDRADELASLSRFDRDDTARAYILSGTIGSGKTKLLFEHAARLSDAAGMFFVREGVVLDDAALERVPSEARVIVVDQLGSISRFDNLVSFIARSPKLKLIVGTSVSNVDSLRYQLQVSGFDPRQVSVPPALGPLKKKDSVEMARALIPDAPPGLLNRVEAISSGLPLVVRLVATLINDSGPDVVRTLVQDEASLAFILARFRDLLSGRAASADVDRNEALQVMQVIAAVGPVDVRTADFRTKTAHALGWTGDRVGVVLHALEEAKVVLRVGSKSRLVPELVRLFMLRQVCSEGAPGQFAARILSSFGPETQFLVNLAAVDTLASDGGNVFRPIWNQLLTRFRDASAFERIHLLDQVEELAFLIPDEMLELVDFLRHNAANSAAEQPLSWLQAYTQDDVLRRIPPVIHNIALSSKALVRYCVRILWELGRDEERGDGYSPGAFRTLTRLAGYGRDKSATLNLEVLREIADICNDPNELRRHQLPIDVVAPALNRTVTAYDDVGTNLTITQYPVKIASVAPVRELAIAILRAVAFSDNERAALRAIGYVEELLRPPHHAGIDVDQATYWNREQLEAIDILDVSALRSPLRMLKVADSVRWHAYVNPNPEVQSRAFELLKRIEGDQTLQLYAALVPELRRNFGAEVPSLDFSALQQRLDNLIRHAARTLQSESVSVTALLARLEDIASDVLAADLSFDAGAVFGQIAQENFPMAVSIADEIVRKAQPGFDYSASAILFIAWFKDTDAAERLAVNAIASEKPTLQRAVADSLWWNFPTELATPSLIEKRLAVLLKLIAVEDEDVISRTIRAIGSFLPLDKSAALRLLTKVRSSANSELLDELFGALNGVDPAEIELVDRSLLLAKMVEAEQLEYWPLDFLKKVSRFDPTAVIDLFLERIQHSAEITGDSDVRYKPVPYASIEPPPTDALFAALRPSNEDVERVLSAAQGAAPTERYWFGELLGSLVANHGEVVLSALKMFLGTPMRPEKLEVVADLINKFPVTIIFDHVQFVESLLDAALRSSDRLRKRVSSALFSAAVSGLRSGVPFEPMPEDLDLWTRASGALEVVRAGSEGARFFTSLLNYAKNEIARKQEHDTDIFGEPE